VLISGDQWLNLIFRLVALVAAVEPPHSLPIVSRAPSFPQKFRRAMHTDPDA
jgi:hypothetical protein